MRWVIRLANPKAIITTGKNFDFMAPNVEWNLMRSMTPIPAGKNAPFKFMTVKNDHFPMWPETVNLEGTNCNDVLIDGILLMSKLKLFMKSHENTSNRNGKE